MMDYKELIERLRAYKNIVLDRSMIDSALIDAVNTEPRADNHRHRRLWRGPSGGEGGPGHGGGAPGRRPGAVGGDSGAGADQTGAPTEAQPLGGFGGERRRSGADELSLRGSEWAKLVPTSVRFGHREGA